jgi:hypothetical protein
MFSAVLFAIALVALGQFALYYWRAVLTGVASQPISDRVLEAAEVKTVGLRGSDFPKLVSLLVLTPQLGGKSNDLRLIRAYYQLVDKVAELFGSLSPAVAVWSEQERVLCARYTAVQVDRRLEANLAQAASVRSC